MEGEVVDVQVAVDVVPECEVALPDGEKYRMQIADASPRTDFC